MSTRTHFLVGALAALSILGLWLRSTAAGTADDSIVAGRHSDAPSRESAAGGDLGLAPPKAAGATRDAASSAANASADDRATAEPVDAEYPLVLRFLRPDRQELTPEHVRVHLESPAGVTRTFESTRQSELNAAIAFGVYRVRVEADGRRHVEETFDFSSEEQFENRDPKLGFFRRVYLWPDNWVAVRLQTPDGEPFESITASFGWEPRRLFVGAFELQASASPIDPTVPPPTGESKLATFRPPKGWHAVRMADDIIGSLEVLAPRPFWVGLWIHGQFHERRVLEQDATELVFVASREQLEDRLCEVRFQLVDRDSGQPVASDALATLKANDSSHRRDELRDRAPNGDGRIEFSQVIPGRHDLTIQRGGSFVQRQLDLDPGETRELGEIAIGVDTPIQLTVVDEDGRPAAAVIEITPYVAGRDVDDLYHPNLHRSTDRKGEYELPVPEVLSIIRARPNFGLPGGRRRHDLIGTHNVLVDPAAPPAALELIAKMPVSVQVGVEGSWSADHRITVEDPAVDLIIETCERRDSTIRLVPGRYRVRHLAGDGQELGARDVEIGGKTKAVWVP